MLLVFFRSALRSLQKRKTTSLLSVLGLSLGFSTFIIISLFIKYELSWDAFHENYEQIYRIQTFRTGSNELVMQSSAAISEHLRDGYAVLEEVSLVFPDCDEFLSVAQAEMPVEAKGQYADQDFLNIFSYDFRQGNHQNALEEPFSILLSESLAITLFGTSDVLGRELVLDKKHSLKITGIFKDQPHNAHLRPEFIISINTLKTLWNNPELFNNWSNSPYYTYVLTAKDADINRLGASIKDLMKDKLPSDYRQLYLRPLADLYMYSTNNNYLIVIYLLGAFAVLVLLLASINYMNLTIASGSTRTKEIGIKKVIGSNRRQLLNQIYFESFLITLCSLFISILIVEISLNSFNDITDKALSLQILLQDNFYLLVLAIISMVSAGASLYPAWLITSVRSIDLFKQKIFLGGNSRNVLKKYLVGFQFAISIALITVAVLMTRQIQYAYEQDLGFNKRNLLFIEMESSQQNIRFSEVKSRLSNVEAIQSVSLSRGFPIQSSRYTSSPLINREGRAREEKIEVRTFWASHDFIQTLEMDIVNGRSFSELHPSDLENGCLINETAAQKFGWDDPVGKYIDDRSLQVVGVFEDILFHDAYNKIKPLVITLRNDSSRIRGPVYFGFRIEEGSEEQAKLAIADAITTTFPGDPFEIKSFESHYVQDQIFKTFRTINSIFIFFSIIGILLSVFGIVGLVNHSLAQRTKEIAIRKVSGCSSAAIFGKLVTEFVMIIAIAAIFGTIAARYLFGSLPIYHPVEFTVLDYLVSVMIALAVSIMAIFYKTLRESSRNPVDALRYE